MADAGQRSDDAVSERVDLALTPVDRGKDVLRELLRLAHRVLRRRRVKAVRLVHRDLRAVADGPYARSAGLHGRGDDRSAGLVDLDSGIPQDRGGLDATGPDDRP